MNVSKRKMCVPERQNQLKCSPSWSTLLCICDIHKMKLFPQYFIFLTYTRWNFFPIASYFWPTQDEFSPHYFIFLSYTGWNFSPITSYFWPTQDETFSLLLHISDLRKMKLFCYFIFLTYTRWNLPPMTSYFWPTQDAAFFPCSHQFVANFLCHEQCLDFADALFCKGGSSYCLILCWVTFFWRRGGLWFACWGIACAHDAVQVFFWPKASQLLPTDAPISCDLPAWRPMLKDRTNFDQNRRSFKPGLSSATS